MPTRVLLIDDHPLIREGLAGVLKEITENTEVLEAESCERALELLAPPGASAVVLDLIVLDLALPGLSGLPALERLLSAARETPIVILAGSADPGLVERSLRSGARGFVPKSTPKKLLVSALQLVFAGGTYVPPHVFLPVAPESTKKLTRRQELVLRLLAEDKSTQEISRSLDIAEVTVRVHIAAILKILGVTTRGEAIQSQVAQRLLRLSEFP